MAAMRAKMQIGRIERHQGGNETIHMHAVAKNGTYPSDGADEDNTYAKFSPSGDFKLTIANPSLIGMFNPGDRFYIDFTKAEK